MITYMIYFKLSRRTDKINKITLLDFWIDYLKENNPPQLLFFTKENKTQHTQHIKNKIYLKKIYISSHLAIS